MRSRLARYRSFRNFGKSLNGMFTTVLPTSTYPSTYKGFPQDMDDWSCAQWKAYYINNKDIIGKQKALTLLDNDISSTGSFADAQMCKYDCEFMNFFAKEGLTGGSIFSKLYCATDSAVDTVKNVVNSAEGVSDFVSKVANNKVLLLGAGVGSYLLYKHFKNG